MTRDGIGESRSVAQHFTLFWTNLGHTKTGRRLHLREEAEEGGTGHLGEKGAACCSGPGRAPRQLRALRLKREDSPPAPHSCIMLDRKSPAHRAHSCSSLEKLRLVTPVRASVASPTQRTGTKPAWHPASPQEQESSRQKAQQWSFAHEGGKYYNHNTQHLKRSREIQKCRE